MAADRADLVVIGSGAAGLVAAVRGHDLGARVVVVEAADVVGGTTAFSGGQVWVGANHLMEGLSISDSVEETIHYVRSLAPPPGAIEDEVLRQWATRAPEVIVALQQAGVVGWTPIPLYHDYGYPEVAGSKEVGRCLACTPINGAELGTDRARLLVSPQMIPGLSYDEVLEIKGDATELHRRYQERAEQDVLTFGTGLVAHLFRGALERRIPVLTEHRAVELLVTTDRVTGVRCETPDGPAEFHGSVLLATGSYDWNPDLVREFSKLNEHQSGSVAPTGIRGDGILLAQQAGAEVYRLPPEHAVHLSGYRAFPEPRGHDGGFRFFPQPFYPHSFLVDATARRFCDDAHYRDITHSVLVEGGRSHLPYYLIFDEAHHRKYGLNPLPPGVPYPPEMGVRSAATIAELAIDLGLDPEVLTTTVEQFNRHAEHGADPDFQRGANEWSADFLGDPSHRPNPLLGPVTEPPFHAIEMRVIGTGIGAAGVHAGPDGVVLRPDRTPIAGLYAAGSTAGFNTSGTGYNSGMAISRALVFGYLAAEHAVSHAAGSDSPATAPTAGDLD